MKKEQEILLCLLKNLVGESPHSHDWEAVSATEWENTLNLAIIHGVAPLLMSEIERFTREQRPPTDILLKWYGQKKVQEVFYQRQKNISCEFASVMAQRGLKCLVLKGFSIASYYQRPETRVFGDLDCFLVKGNKPASIEGDTIANEIGAEVEYAGYKHTHIHYKNLLVENHKYLTNFNQTKQGIKTEKLLQQLALKGKGKRLNASNLWCPSPEFNVLFLLKHSLDDFIANDMSLRTLYDWTVFLTAECDNIDWDAMNKMLEYCKLKNFFVLLTETCKTYLGLKIRNLYLSSMAQEKMATSLLNDVLNKPSIGCGHLPFKKKIPNIIKRFRRQWKYRAIETEKFGVIVKNTILYSSLFRRKVSLD